MCLLCPLWGYGQEAVSAEASGRSDKAGAADSVAEMFRLDELEVRAQRREQPVFPVQRLEGARLQSLGSQSVADAVRYFSGVQIKDYGGVGGLKTIDVRSMGTHHLGVFYDGIEVGNAQNGTVDLGKFSMDNIEEISLYNGQKPELFQPAKDYGSAGTLYLRTRRPRFVEGKPYNIRLSLRGGTFGLANPSVLYEQRLTEHIHLSASAEYTHAHGHYHFRYRRVLPSGAVAWDTTAVRQNGDVEALRAEAALFGYLHSGKWHAKGYYYQSARGIPGAIVNNVWTNSQRQWDRNAFAQGNLTYSFAYGIDMQFNAKYSNDRLRYLNPDTTLMYIDNTFLQQEVYMSLASRWRIFSAAYDGLRHSASGVTWDLSLSGDWQWNTLDANLANFVYPTRHTGLVAAATALEWRYVRAQASLLGTFTHDRTRLAAPTPLRTDWSPAVYLSCRPILTEHFYLRAFYKRVMRMPTFNDLYYTDVGNISLQPETAVQYDGGVQYDKTWARGVFRALSVKADGYFNQIHNKIVAIPKGNGQYRWQMMNLGYVEIRGCDINASTTLWLTRDVFFTLAGAYTFQRAQDFTDPQDITYGGQIAYIPWHSGSVTAELRWRGLAFNYAFIYVGERYHNSANIPANYQQPWYTHDLALHYDLPLPAHGKAAGAPSRSQTALRFALEVNNVLNQQYEVILNYPMPGINGRGTITLIL